MALSVVLLFSVIFVIFVVVSHKIIQGRQKDLEDRRKEIVALYVKRANLMPVFLASARRHSPIPPSLHNRFIAAKGDFAKADKLENVKDRNNGIKAANKELDRIFADLFAKYEYWEDPLYLKAREDYTKIIEKISFAVEFYEASWRKYIETSGGPLRYGDMTASALKRLFKKQGRAA